MLIVTVSIGSPVRSLAGLYSFGVLLTFTAAQLAVIKPASASPISRVRTARL